MHEFEAKRVSINLILTLVATFSGFAGIPVGWLLRCISVRVLVVVGIIGQGIGFLLVATSGSMDGVLFGYGIVVGLFDALIGLQVTNLLIVSWFERRRGMAVGLSVASASVASIVFPPLTTVMIAAYGWRTTFVIYALALFALIPLALTKGAMPAEMPPQERVAGRVPESMVHGGKRLDEAARTVDFWVIALVVGSVFAVNVAMLATVVPYARANGLDPLAAAGLLSLQGLFALLGKLTFGAVADRFSLRVCLFAATIFGAAGMAFLLAGASKPLLVGGVVCFGLCIGGTTPLFGVITARMFGLRDYAMVLGASRTVMTPLLLSTPLFVGYIYDRLHTWGPVFATFLIVLIAAALASLRLRLPPRHAPG